ncbi:MAG TPA: PAC2 family protein, partial [Acidimicrobiales bacterium]|nr:PAC2 family protein [Acidimicrobiales bacterium]
MDVVRWQQRPRLRRPVLMVAFAGWNDAADAATGAADYLAQSWQARTFADLDPEEFFDFTVTRPQIRLEDGLTRRLEWPTTTLAAASVPGADQDLVLLRGPEPGLRWRTYAQAVLGVANDLGVELVVGLGALLADVPHTRPVKVTGTAMDQGLVDRLGLRRSRYEGPTGMLGVLHDAFAGADIPTASLWAAVPHYVAQSPSPKATLALVEHAAALLGTSVDATDLQVAASSYERQVDELVAADEDAAASVARLEEAGDEDDDEEHMASGGELADEAARF